ncbi:peptidase T [Aestuariivirga sp. YIM B02566]|uniref:Peptidase T n=1 Tax=Taklimakanibacter albus TaxID=2800327 RepID=A0ACC5R9Q0_9HYPH|nr:peptidase T [Aestuariivirga sp. YIM B02566]MBK1869396.1 peptidase T [Aestuariivirga sp. YIM B02566]
MNIRPELLTRFFRYVAIESQSDQRTPALPSTAGQHALAALLAAEMCDLGLDDVMVDENAIVTAVKRGNRSSAPKIGFIAHLDTADVGLSPSISPQILRFAGEDLCLNWEKDIWFRAADHPEAMAWSGHDVIFSDGTSVLGADNKAAIAVIMTLLSQLRTCDAHGDICVAFVPDEEIGLRGAKALDLSRFPCDFAYTIDCCELGEVVVENFNAALVEITFTGVSAHPMSAKGVMVNPLLMALDFVAQFDRSETPECTEGREGYFWFSDLAANDGNARLTVMIRDFDKAVFEHRKRRIGEVAELIRQRYPRGQVEFEISDTYSNIGDSLGSDRRSIDLLLAALKELGITPKLIPMRGGTDGAALSARGLPTPNFFTGAHNFHSRFEFLPVAAFEKSFEVALAICKLAAK